MSSKSNISSINHNLCTGCAVCSTVCPTNAIIMRNEKDGFLYPQLDKNKCITCGLCYSKCHTTKENTVWNTDILYAGSFDDPIKLSSSSSGGAATAISEIIIKHDGIVYGVTYSDDFRHEEYHAVGSIDELEKFKSSKYSQADPPDYADIKEKLESNTLVCFIGLPCQCDALHAYLDKEYKNLILVSLVCHGPTSPLVLRRYIDEIEEKNGKLISFRFRFKKNGYTRPSRIYCKFESGKEVIKPFISSSYGMAFEILNRESCSFCHSKYPHGNADFIIGDFWGGKSKDSKQSEKGESMLILRNQDKVDIIDKLSEVGFSLEKVDITGIEKKNPSLVTCSKIYSLRDAFVDDLQNMTLRAAIKKNTSLKQRFINSAYYLIRSIVPHELWKKMR